MEQARQRPMHLWIVGILATLWNGFGAYDYLMSRMRNAEYLRAMMPSLDPAAAFAYMDSMPLLAQIGWGLGVWGALAGSLLLLAQNRHAVIAFLVSLVGIVISFGMQFTGPKPPPGMDDPIMPLVIAAIGVALLIYARTMKRRGVLR